VEDFMFKNFSWKSAVFMGALSFMACKGVCGDGVVDAENKDGNAEACDDNNTGVQDGCNGICVVEAGFACTGEPSVCSPNIESIACDDGLDNDGDGQTDCDDVVDCGDNDLCKELICDDGIDDDGDGDIDCDDAECNGNDACIELQCADGLDDEGDGLIDCADGDCLFSPDCQEAGDGFMTPDPLNPNAAEQCDDGNFIAGDGCLCTAGAGCKMEAQSDVIVALANPDLNNQDTETAVFSAVFPFVLQFDLDNDDVVETNLLMAVTSDRATICQDMFNAAFSANGQDIGPLNTVAALGGLIPGTEVVTFIQTSDVPLGVGAFQGAGQPPLTKILQTNGQAGAGEVFTEIGFITLDNAGNALSDTTFASDGAGLVNITAFNVVDTNFVGFENAAGDPIPIPVGNVAFDFAAVNMVGQFIATADQDLDNDGTDETKAINQPITGTIKASTCGAVLFF
jgi:cysteine-rich repeat protein